MGQRANGRTSEQLVELFERAMVALWNRSQITLGEITLAAIVDRVFYSAAEQFPPFQSLKVEQTGIDFKKFRAQNADFNSSELSEGVRFVITEFIVVIGNLTAEILTPALHEELSKVTLRKQALAASMGEENHEEATCDRPDCNRHSEP
jgi:hypothetical protein